MAMKYFLPKIATNMSYKTVNTVSCVVAAIIMVFFYIHNLKEVKANGKNYYENSPRRDGRR